MKYKMKPGLGMQADLGLNFAITPKFSFLFGLKGTLLSMKVWKAEMKESTQDGVSNLSSRDNSEKFINYHYDIDNTATLNGYSGAPDTTKTLDQPGFKESASSIGFFLGIMITFN